MSEQQREARGVSHWLRLIADLTVIAGIIVLAVEVRMNANATRAEIRAGIAESSRVHSRWTAEHPEIIALDYRWERGEDLNEVELQQVMAFRYAYWRQFENAHYQYRNGTFDQVEWQGYERNMACAARQPGHAAYLERAGFLFSSAFTAYIRSLNCIDR